MGIRITRLLGRAGLLLLLTFIAAPLGAQRDSEFMKDFRAATSKGDKQRQDAVMKKHQEAAVLAIIETCQEISKRPSAGLEGDMTAMAASWNRVHKTSFADSQYKYFSLMNSGTKRSRTTLNSRFWKVYGQFEVAKEAQKKHAYAGFGIQFLEMSKKFAQLGDLYMASVTAGAYADCVDEPLNAEKANLKRTCEGYGMVVKHLERLGLKTKGYRRAKIVFDDLEYQGYGDPSKGPEARKRAKAEADPSYRATPLEMQFEIAPSFSSVARPNYGADSIYQVWHTIRLTRVGTTGKITQLGELSPAILRQGAAKVALDNDGDGKGETPIAVNGNLKVVRCQVGKGDARREWAFQAITGSNTDTMQGIRPFNLASDESNMAIFVAPAASMVGMIAETRIQVIDDNMDGYYGSNSLGWALLGLRSGDDQIEVDSIVLGKSKRAMPWSEKIKIGEDWYALYPKPDGSGLTYNKVDVETGIIKLELKGLRAEYMLVQGTGNNSALCFDIAAIKKGVEVPAGSYALLAGVVSKGKRAQKLKAMVLGGASMPLMRVKAGETLSMSLGAPFKFEFEFEQDGKQVKVDGGEIVVAGRGGETYQRLWNCRIQPEISLRKVGSRKGTKGQKMRIAEDQNELTEHGYGIIWGPYDTAVPKKSTDKMEVQLFEKKNKLFGKITSDWKKE